MCLMSYLEGTNMSIMRNPFRDLWMECARKCLEIIETIKD